ncbi:MAG: hypothetical protein LBT97_07765 [Planctomycetota bacterium]|nr:hypothetical protein [Planctomycetota bacterium]
MAGFKGFVMADGELYEIILETVDGERRSAAALFLSGCFSLPPAATRRIVAAAPLALLSGLAERQAAGMLKELSAALPDGVRLRVAKEGVSTDAGKLEWPTPPKIHGRDLGDFGRLPEHSVTACPACGRLLKVTFDPDGGLGIGLSGMPGKTVMIPNPASVASDKDPLFSGFKPLVEGAADLASLRSLQAGDSGFWIEARQNFFPQSASGTQADRGDATAGAGTETGIRDKRGESAAEPAAAPAGTGGLAAFMKQGLYAVVLSRTRDPQTVKMLSDVMGIDEGEARELASSRSLCVAKSIALDEARTLVARFRSLGANARIVKPM